MSRGHIRELRSRTAALHHHQQAILMNHSGTCAALRHRKPIKKRKNLNQPTYKKRHHKNYQLGTVSSPPLESCQSFTRQSQSSDSKLQVASMGNSDIEIEPIFQGYSSLFEFGHNANHLTNSSIGQIWTYMGTIGEHLFRQESLYPIPPLAYNQGFGPNQRLYSMKLISCFCAKLNFRPETHFLAVNIFHRICTASDFIKVHNSLKAASALFIAAKYQQIAIPRVQTFSCIDFYYKIESSTILDLESRIVIYLGFNLSFTSPLHFVDLLAAKYKLDASTRDKAIYLSRRSLMSDQLSLTRGSLLALACLEKVVPLISICAEVSNQVRKQVGWRLDEMTRLGLC